MGYRQKGTETVKDYEKKVQQGGDKAPTKLLHDALAKHDVAKPQGQKNRSELLAGATRQLQAEGKLPREWGDTDHQSAYRVVGTTADTKDPKTKELVVAYGRDAQGRAKQIYILGRDGKFYEAEKTKDLKGYQRKTDAQGMTKDDLEKKVKEKERASTPPSSERTVPAGSYDSNFRAANGRNTFQESSDRDLNHPMRISIPDQDNTQFVRRVANGVPQGDYDMYVNGQKQEGRYTIERGNDGSVTYYRVDKGWTIKLGPDGKVITQPSAAPTPGPRVCNPSTK